MTICEQCGAPTQSGESFCGACGAYLEWQEPTTGAAGPIAPAPPVQAPSAPSPAEPPAAPAPSLPPSGDLPDGGQPASPVAAADPAPERAAPVRPGTAAPRSRRQDLPADDRRPLPGETVCPDCGAGNLPTRRFCRRCGADLVDAPVEPRLPWYRRLFTRTPRPARAAGARPTRRRRRKGLDRRLGIAILLLVIVGGGWFGRARATGAVDLARDRISQEVVHATTFAASSQARGHPASAVGDGAPNSYWSPTATGAAEGEHVTLGLETPVRLAYVKVFNGPSSEPGKAFLATARLSTVRLTMTTTDGKEVTRSITLADAPGGQDFHLGVNDVVSVRVTVVGAYGADGERRVALGEVELFRRS